MEKLLNFNEPIDVDLLDRIVGSLYTGTPQERAAAQQILTQFQQHPDSWLRADAILERSKNMNSKYFALQVLEGVIKYRWKILPREQCEGIKNYIVNLVIKLSTDPETLQRERTFINKLDLILVQIIKQEWPHQWRNFIPEIVGASKTKESLCENNMNIFKILSEEVFDFSSGEMTQAKIKELKESFNQEFQLIFQLCDFILGNSQNPTLIATTLQTLLKFLNWIPLGYIFETNMINMLVNKFFPVPQFRNSALQCLTEIGSLDIPNMYTTQFEQLFIHFMRNITMMLPPTTNIPDAYERGSDEDQAFIQYLSLFFTGFLKFHLKIVERPEYHAALLQAHDYLVEVSKVDDVEIFKTCLEYWNFLAQNLYLTEKSPVTAAPTLFLNNYNSSNALTNMTSPRRQLYAPIMSKVRRVLISKMAKPEEVIIVEDENGEVVREYMKDVDAIQLYKSMRETLIYLTNLDCDDTEKIMLEKLAAQVDGSEWSWSNLNTLCWAIGSISGAMSEKDEKRFLVNVIKDLLGLCEMKRGKDNKAIVASNIMYVVGQYPRFLRAHWKFLKTVVNKLFEFMHEKFPGVQDMACDTFLKIAQKCRRKFVQSHPNERRSFVEELLDDLPSIISDLEPAQIHTFYEAVGYMISVAEQQQKEALIRKFMELPNQRWGEIMQLAAQNVENLKNPDIMRDLVNLLKTNVRAASSLRHAYMFQLRNFYRDMLEVYKAYSQMISAEVLEKGPTATKYSNVRAMRAVKKEVLKVVETFIQNNDDPAFVAQHFIPPLLEAVLVDYHSSVPDARDPGVLSVMAVAINKLRDHMTPEIPRILEAVLECTLPMITKNFEDYPEHRINFFTLLLAINKNCFQAFFAIPPQGFKLVLDSVLWAVKHTERNISETGLTILLELLQNVEKTEAANAFYQTYYLLLLQELFVVLTDTLHKPGFKLQAQIIQHMCRVVEEGRVTAPLFDTTQYPQGTDNRAFLKQHILTLLSTSFPNVSSTQMQAFVLGLFDLNKDQAAFKEHLRDFLVRLKEFAGDNSDLYEEERQAALAAQREQENAKLQAVPGLVAPKDQDDMAE